MKLSLFLMSRNAENPSIFDAPTITPVEKLYIGGKTIETVSNGSHIIVLHEEPLKSDIPPLRGVISYTKDVDHTTPVAFAITRMINGYQSRRHMQFEDGVISLLHNSQDAEGASAHIDMQTGTVLDYQSPLIEGVEKDVPNKVPPERLHNILTTAELIMVNKPYYSFSDLKGIINCFETLGVPTPVEISVFSS